MKACRCASSRVPATARSSPNAAPQHESATLSVSICRSSRERPAPKRRPHRHFLLPRAEPRQLQIRKIRAHNQHHDADRAGQHEQSRAHRSAHVLRQCGPAWERSGSVPDAGLPVVSPAALTQPARPAIVAPGFSLPMIFIVFPARLVFVVQRPGNKDIDGCARGKDAREIKGRRQHAHHRRRAGCSESACGPPRWGLKQTAAAKSCSSKAWPAERNTSLALLGGERSSDGGLHTQQCEEVPGHGNAGEALGLAGSRQFAVARAIESGPTRQIGERAVQLPEVRIVFGLGGGQSRRRWKSIPAVLDRETGAGAAAAHSPH